MFVFGFIFLRWHNLNAHANNVKLIRRLEKLPKSQKPKVITVNCQPSLTTSLTS